MNKELIKKSLLGGLMIGIGSILFLSIDNPILSSIYFSFGLITIIIFNLNLFTGKIGYINKTNIFNIFIILLFNIIGVYLCSFIFKNTNKNIILSSTNIIINKINQNTLINFINSIGCGILIFLAVDYHKHFHLNLLYIIFCVSSFILLKFNHCIADSFYIFTSGILNLQTLKLLIIDILGNSIGSIFLFKLIYNKRNE